MRWQEITRDEYSRLYREITDSQVFATISLPDGCPIDPNYHMMTEWGERGEDEPRLKWEQYGPQEGEKRERFFKKGA